tara:strand:+ start:508 stop:609 length:102 start_codon:yes stop_codon:yes gene_type:complete
METFTNLSETLVSNGKYTPEEKSWLDVVKMKIG